MWSLGPGGSVSNECQRREIQLDVGRISLVCQILFVFFNKKISNLHLYKKL